jgi:hypothetical protein
MITGIVLFRLTAGMTRERHAAAARGSAATWDPNPDPTRKNHPYDAERGYGSEATFTCHDTPLLVDNEVRHIRAAA